ncbi:MAG: HPr(Ser) kinase/phosphatase [Pyrinomonadaceae bacterium]
MSQRPAITVEQFLTQAPPRLEMRLIAGARGCSSRQITDARVHKLGLALAGFPDYIRPGRVQLVGQSEIWYLDKFDSERRLEAITNLSLKEISCILLTKNIEPPLELLAAAHDVDLPLLQTPLVSSVAIGILSDYLQEMLAPRDIRHGVLLDLYGLGVLIEGRSGIGKSECALDLVSRGHRLVSDDMVEVKRVGSDRLIGSAPNILREHLEIRGLGIINIKDLFGVSAISGPLGVGLSIRLERWDEAGDVERLGLDAQTIEILGLQVPHVLLPVSPGRNLSTLVETAVRVHLLRLRGYDAARIFVARHEELVASQLQTSERRGEERPLDEIKGVRH